MHFLTATGLFALVPVTAAQILQASVHSTGFNSSFSLTPAQIQEAQLSPELVSSLEAIVNFDRSQLAFGGSREDDFYNLPHLTGNDSAPLSGGQLLKVQPFTDPTAYALPPNTALSRILYTTKTFNGTVVPTSGFVLWPFSPRASQRQNGAAKQQQQKAQLVVWTHGTSGFFAPAAPSAHRSLWYAHSAPFALAQAGYAVFAPDYAGLGVGASWDGAEIPHQYLAAPATAADALFGVQAVLEAFVERLEPVFVVMGHSQGGGVAWAVGEALAAADDEGVGGEFAAVADAYRGAVAASPSTEVLASPPSYLASTVATMLHSILPEFEAEDWLTPLGAARLRLIREIEGSISVVQLLMMGGDADVVKPDFNETWSAQKFAELVGVGRKECKGPVLVLQGTEDLYVPYDVTLRVVEDTWASFPDGDLELLVVPGVGHFPVLDATRQQWLRWIGDRLDGKPLAKGGAVRTKLQSFLPITQYLGVATSFPLWAGLPEYAYEIPVVV